MGLIPFQRLTSNITQPFLRAGTDRDVAAMNAANGTGPTPVLVNRNLNPGWPSLKKFDNDTEFVFSAAPNPDYIWVETTSDGQTAAFANASREFSVTDFPGPEEPSPFAVTMLAFSDNAMKAKIELFQKTGELFYKAVPQPPGLGDVMFVSGFPNTPSVGIGETVPYSWQDVRMYSTTFEISQDITATYKFVVSFEVTNYLPTANNPNNPNPAGLQFIVDFSGNVPIDLDSVMVRLTSNTSDVFLGSTREEAASNAANQTGMMADLVDRNLNPVWPSIQKFDNDTSNTDYSPLGNAPNPQYVWDQPASDGQTAYFAVATFPFLQGENFRNLFFSFSLAAFADNAMTVTIELFERIGGSFVRADPQPIDFPKNFVAGSQMPATGLTEIEPFNWRDIRMFSTTSAPPTVTTGERLFVYVFSFEVTNYLPTANNPNNPNPAGLQFIIDINVELTNF